MCQQSKMISFLRQQVLGFIQFNRTSGSLRRAKSSRLVSKRGAGRALAATYLLSAVACALLLPIKAWSVEAGSPNTEVLIEVAFDGLRQRSNGPTDTAVDGAGAHTPGLDGQNGAIPSQQNGVVRTNDSVGYTVHWNVNDVDSAASPNAELTDGIATNVVITIDTGRPDVFFEELSDRCLTRGAGLNPVSSFTARGTSPNGGALLICNLGDVVEGTGGTISPVVTVGQKLDGSPSDGDVVPMQASITTDQSGDVASNTVNTTISAAPAADWVKGVPDIMYGVDNAGAMGAVIIYPLALELAGADSREPQRGVDNFADVPITFYDHAWDLTPNATLLPAAVGAAIGRAACGPYDGSGSYPYGDGLSGDAVDNEVNPFTMACTDLGGVTGTDATPGDTDNGIVNYPLIQVVISGQDTTTFPKFFASGVSVEDARAAYVISAQLAFWIPQADLDAKDPLGGAPNALNDYFNTINADATLDTTGADAPTGVVPNTEAIVLVPGVVDVVENSIINNGRVAVITDVPPPSGGPGVFQYSGYNHSVSIYKGPYKELADEVDGAALVRSQAADGRDPIAGGIGREGDFFLNNGQDAVSRNELLTVVAKIGAGSTDHGRIDDDPVHLCVELDNTYMDLIDFPSDFQITTLPPYSVFSGNYDGQTDLAGGYPPVSVTTGSPSNGLAHVIMGTSNFDWFVENVNAGLTYKQMWGIFDDGDNPDYVVEVAEVPLAASDPENRLVNETTCNDAEATWVDATDTAALAALVTGTDTDGNNVYGNVTKVRVRMLERHNWRGRFWYQEPDFRATSFGDVTAGIAYQLALQTRVKPDISLTPIDEHVYVHAARGRGDWVGQPEAGVAPAPLTRNGPGYCAGRRAERTIDLGNWMSIDNPNLATVNNGYAGATGWCSLAYNNTNEKHYIDGLDLDPGAFESRSDPFRSTGQDGTSQSGDPANPPRSPFVIAHADMVNIVEARLAVNKTNLTGITNLAVNGDEYTFEIETSIVGSPDELFGDVTVTDLITSGAGHANFEFVSMTAPVDADDNPITGTANCTDSLAGVFGDVQCVFSGGAGSGDYRSSPFYAKFQVTVRMVNLRANQRYENTITASAERLTAAGGSFAPQVFETKIGNDVVYSSPAYNEITVRKDVPDLGGDCTVDPGSSAVAANTLFAGDCSVFRIGDEYSYVLTVDNNGLGNAGSVVIIDALPHTADGTELAASFIGTPAGTDAGDGRTPASNFSGTSELVSITTTGGGATVECTSDPVASINRNPDDNTNAWGATCDSTSTGFRVTFSALNVDETKTVTVNLLPADSAKSDIYTNNFGARAANIDVPVRSNDVSAMIQGVSVGGTLWLDADYDSLQDANEPTIEGATVTLLDSAMVPIPGATVVTGPDGLYYFEHLPDGDYYVQVDVPSAEYEPVTTQGTSNSDIADDSSIATTNSPTQYVSDVITLSTGGEPDANTETGPISGTDDDADNALETNGNLTVDMGFMVVPDIELTKSSGIITDVNNNGITDAGDTIAYSFSVENTGGTILAPVTISDPKLGLTNAACVPTLAVGATATCSTTGNYTILQSDVEAGGVENVATTLAPSVDNNGGPLDDPANPGTPIAPVTDTSDTGTDNGAPVTDPDMVETLNPLDENANVTTDPKDDPTTVLIAPVPGIELTKSVTSVTDVNSNGLTDAGDIIAYSFVVENTGNTILAPVTFSDAKLVLTNVACVDSLAVGATATCTTTGNYTILQADVEVGGVENVATATGTPVDSAGAVLNDISGSPLGPVTDTSDTGTDPETNVITDPDTVETPNPLDDNPNDSDDPKDDPTTVLITPTPQIEITKSITAVTDVNTNGLTDVGDTISYSFVVENTGSTILTPVTISDAKLGIINAACVPTLAIGASATCTTTGSYTIMQIDVEAGGVENVATTSGTPVNSVGGPLDDPANPGTPLAAVTDTSDTGTDTNGNMITDPDTVETPNPLDENPNESDDPKDDPTTYLITPVPDIELTKSITTVTDVNGNGFTDAGDTVEYSFSVENTGNVILAPVTITDAKLGLTDVACVDSLAVGATETCTTTGSYTILQADVEAGGVENVATATGTPVDSNGDRLDDPANPGTPLIPVTDTSDTGTDPDTTVIPDPDTVETPNPLDENSNDGADPKDDPTTLLIAPMPLIEITKSVTSVTDVNSNGLTDAGDIIAYSFVVENTGNTILAPVTISDVKLGITDAACVTSLAVGATATCTTTGNYTILQADVEAGGVENVATTAGTPVDSNGVGVDDPANPGTPLGPVTDTSDTGTDPDTNVITDPDTVETPNPLDDNPNDSDDPKDDPTTVLITPTPQIEITKSITAVTDVNTNGLTDVGDTISYSFVVENTGSTILMPVTISDAKLGLTDAACVDSLLIGASATCTTTGSYTIMQVDVEAGGVENVATTTGTPVDSNDDPLDDPANPGTPLTPVTDTSDTGTDTNGNMIPDPDTVETPNPLDENVNDTADPKDDPTTYLITPVPDIELTKSITAVTDVNGNGFTDAGDTVEYSFSVENTGSTILAPVTISDAKLGLTDVACVDSLAVGATEACTTTAIYTILQSDVEAGGVENVATATGTPVDSNGDLLDDPANPGTPLTPVTDTSDTGTGPDTSVITDPDTVETSNPLDQNPNDGADPKDDPTTLLIAPMPELELTKSITSITDVNSNGLTDAGDIIAYAFMVENTGNTVLAPVTFSDPKLAIIDAACVTTLAVGASATCTTTGSYTILQADVEAGGVENVATATGSPVDSSGDPLNDISGTPLDPVMDTSDTGTDANGSEIPDPDTDETPNPLDETPDDPDDPTDDPTVLVITPTPQIEITKSITTVTDVNANSLTDVGDTISYSFVVENTGSTILAPVTISDAKLGLTGAPCVDSLLIGASATCTTTGSYTIMQVDIEAGGVENVATTTGTPVDSNDDPLDDPANPGTPLVPVTDTSDTGTDVNGNVITNPDTVETPNPLGENPNEPADPKDDPTTLMLTPVPDIELTKSITAVTDVNGNGFTDAGDTVEYSFSVENTGNTILAPVTISDAKLGLTDVACVDSLAVGATEACTTTAIYTILQSDVEAGAVENVATATATPVDSNGDLLDDPANPGTPLIPVTDTSDTGTDADGNVIPDPDTDETPNPLGENPDDPADPTDDPTVLIITPMPQLELTKSAGAVTDVNTNGITDVGDTIAYTFTVENTGNTILAPVTISDAKLGLTDVACVASLAVGANATCTTLGSYAIVQADIDAGFVENVATTTGTPVDSTGGPLTDVSGTPVDPVMDTSDAGTDSDGNPITDPDTVETPNPLGENPNDPDDPTDDPTTTMLTPIPPPSLIISKEFGGIAEVSEGVYRVTFNMVVINDGDILLENVQIVDDLNAMLNNPVASGAQVSNASVVDNSAIAGTTPLVVSNTYTGTGDNNLLAPTGNTLVPGAIGNVSVSFDLTPARYYGPFNNVALASGVDPLGNVETDSSENSATPTSTNGGGDFTSETPFGVTPPSTPITLGWFRASDNLNGTVNIEWQTETEIANAGFYLSSVDSDGNVKRLNETIILSQGDASSAQSYSFVATTEQTQFMLTDVGVAGKEVIHGPFNLGEEHGFLSKPRPIDWDAINQESEEKKTLREQQRMQEMQRKLNQFKNLQSNSDDTENKGASYYVAKAAAFILSALVAPAQAIDLVSFEVEQAGVYEVTHQDLMNSGLDLRGIATNRIGLKENSQLWPISINTGASASFTDSSSLVFAGRALSTLYSKINRYTLVLDEGQLGIEQDDTSYPGSDIALASSYLGEKVYAPQNKYSFYSPEPDDSWFADQLSAFDSPGVSKTVTLNISDYAPAINYGFSSSGVTRQPALRPALEVSLWGASTFDGNGAAQPDHHVLVDFNGQQVINSRFDGFRTKTEKAGLTSLQIGNNTIKVSVPKDTGYLYDIVMLNHITLKYPKKFVAEGQGSLVFNSNWSKFRVKGLDSAEATVIRMDADGNGYFMAQRGVGSCTNSCVYFAGSDTEQEDTYYVATNSGTLKPTVSVAADSAMSSGAAKYVIISHPDFIGTSSSLLENYANEITSQYGTVDLIDVETIYAEYSGGVVDAAAIAQFIEDAYHNRGTRHILLVGGDVYDYHDNLETGSRSFIPSIYTPVANNVTSVPSDASYALIDNDLVPDLSIARLPVRTTGELANLVTKRQRYLARDYGNKALFAADRLDASNYSFKSDSERLIFDHFRNNWSVDKVYYDDAATTLTQARLNIQNAINGGVGVVSYFGHSSADRWSLSGMLTADDVSGLNNFQKPTVVVQGGCSNTFYVSPNTEPMAHRFLVEGEQGAVTVMGASSYTQATAEKRMSGFLFKFLKQGMSIGDAVLAAKQQIAIDTPYQLDVLLGWAVLGFDDMPVYQ